MAGLTYRLHEIGPECHHEHSTNCWIHETNTDTDEGTAKMALAELLEKGGLRIAAQFMLNVDPHFLKFLEHLEPIAGVCTDPSERLECVVGFSMQ